MKTLTELKSFLTLWLSQSASSLGTAMTEYALTVWVYQQKGTAMSLTMLTLCTFLPTILLRFVAGALADRWDKKRIMLLSDAVAACGTLTILVLHRASALEAWHLYVINFLLSCMNAFQIPASYVATSLLVPKAHYAKAGGLQSASGAIISIAAPALGSLVFSSSGLGAVLIIDLMTFAVAFQALLFFIKLPATEKTAQAEKQSIIQDCLFGLRWLKSRASLLRLILFFTIINFLAKLGGDGMLPAFVLSRTGNNQPVLAMTQAAVSIGLLSGSALVTLLTPPKNPTRAVFALCGVTFLTGNAAMSLCKSPILWCACNFVAYMSASMMGVHLGAYMRESVPIHLQGRIFSARDTIQSGAIPLGLYLGGILADKVFEPIMQKCTLPILQTLFGNTTGSGLALQFFIIGLIGAFLSLIFLLRKDPD